MWLYDNGHMPVTGGKVTNTTANTIDTNTVLLLGVSNARARSD